MGSFWHVLTDNWDVIGPHFLSTIELFVIAAVSSLVLGTLLTAMRVSPIPALRAFGTSYVQLLRNTPLTLVFALLVFAVPKLNVTFDYFTGACIALTAYTSAFVCEVLRSGINTVPVGQAEAARALGMTFGQVLGSVVLPQAFRSIVPPMMSVLIAMLKNTTVAAGFSVAEAGAIRAYLAERGENQIQVLLWIAIGFLIIIAPLVYLQRRLERRWKVAR
ncbi:amino acid ABC transporter permease [Dactylosporangium fulvum]|uniref:Amino acid ABC transporter permease n=1 Tax=Dactylosporangium fulvum TaxID=53359 RepID=A0ABY5W4C3_9ACTN|nr:amino acid ABC transporter permease [Dactylosporangium fulvum]UWP84240.1 amino acid ABC transporter permease [Dactylosporangium fulvum]